MIGKLKGKLVEVNKNVGLIETSGGVGYLVYLTPHLISLIPKDSLISIYTYLQVRDDALVLFGFKTVEECDFFKELLTVPGVGPKTAFSVISFGKTEDIIKAVKENNIDYFTKIPGLGKKTGMKIILELSQKFKEEFNLEKMYLTAEDKTVVDALVSLGFKTHEAKNILSKLPKNLSLEEKIKKALNLSSKNI